MKEITLHDLTKEELIELFQRHVFKVDQEELVFIVYQRKRDKAMDEMDLASEQMRSSDLSTKKGRESYAAASHRWTVAEKKLQNLREEMK